MVKAKLWSRKVTSCGMVLLFFCLLFCILLVFFCFPKPLEAYLTKWIRFTSTATFREHMKHPGAACHSPTYDKDPQLFRDFFSYVDSFTKQWHRKIRETGRWLLYHWKCHLLLDHAHGQLLLAPNDFQYVYIYIYL